MKKIYLVLILVVVGYNMDVLAQQDPQFSQNMFTKLAVNPAYAGSSGAICGTLLYRNQWTGFGGEPKSFLFTGDALLEDIPLGVGLTVISDQLGFDKNLGIRAAVSYPIDLGSGKLNIGVDGGLYQKSMDGTKFIANQILDPNIPIANVSASSFDLGAGLYYYSQNLYVGASASHLTEGSLKYATLPGLTTTLNLARHYYFQAGYNIELTQSLDLKPSVLAKTDAASTQLDVNAMLMVDKKYWAGLSYRLQDAMVIMIGIEVIPNLKVGYSYDLTLSDIKTYSSGTHEVMVGYCFKPIKRVVHSFHRNVRNL